MNRDCFVEGVLRQLEAWSNEGDTTNELGTRLIGHAPHVAPRAYFHVVYAPLKRTELDELTGRLGRPLPLQFSEFLTQANGLSVFVGSMRVLGYVPLVRRASTSVYNYPSDIVVRNVSARIKGLGKDALVVGWYAEDGSYVSIEGDGSVVRFDARGSGSEIQTWADFDTWLIEEIAALRRKQIKAVRNI